MTLHSLERHHWSSKKELQADIKKLLLQQLPAEIGTTDHADKRVHPVIVTFRKGSEETLAKKTWTDISHLKQKITFQRKTNTVSHTFYQLKPLR